MEGPPSTENFDNDRLPTGADPADDASKSHAVQPKAPQERGRSQSPGECYGVPWSRVVVYFSLALVGGGLDLWTKEAIFRWRGLPGQRDIWWVMDGYFGIETAVNIGAVFGVGAGKGILFASLSILAAVGIWVWLFWFQAARAWWLTVTMGLITGGIIGNLYDRLGMWWQPGYPPEWKSGVRDWILWQASDQWKWPNFNIADSLLVVGAGMLLWQSFFFPPGEEHSPEERSSSEQLM